jgi:uncharacterized SAM-binding protein YcdF (DUF218 family)
LLTSLLSPLHFVLAKIILQPLPALLLLCSLALANLWRKRVESRRRLLFMTIPFAILMLTTMPAAVYPLVGSLEWPYPPMAAWPPDVGAIVILSGGIKSPDATRARAELSEASLNRCLLGADLYRLKPCPVIVAGGRFDTGSNYPPDAALMREILVRLGVNGTDVIEESKSRNTYENAAETRELLVERRIHKILLVTNAFHMRRSLLCFRKQGIGATAAPCGHLATEFRWEPDAFVPSPRAAGELVAALHEWLGIAWYRVRGRI